VDNFSCESAAYRAAINDWTLTAIEIRDCLAEIVTALKELHSHGIVHMDLKLENILLDTDFRISRFVRGTYPSAAVQGTKPFIAPEVLRNHQHTFACDWWALGVLAFRLEAGYLPFRYINIQHQWELFKRMDAITREFIQGLLFKDPHVRLGAKGKDSAQNSYFQGIEQRVSGQDAAAPDTVGHPGLRAPVISSVFLLNRSRLALVQTMR
jgi:serine/threonine protein kinase